MGLNPDKTNSPTYEKEEATHTEEAESLKAWFREKDCSAAEGREPWSRRRSRETGGHTGMCKENVSPKPLAWNMRMTEYCELWQLACLKAWSSKDHQAWLRYRQECTVLLLERSQANNLGSSEE